MLQYDFENIKLELPEEAELGSAGEQPNRNSLANWNNQSGGWVSPSSDFKLFWSYIPKKTHEVFFDFCTLFLYPFCMFFAVAVRYKSSVKFLINFFSKI